MTAGSKRTAAVLVIRFTDASATPGSAARVRCTRAWHAAQVIPVTGKEIEGLSSASSRVAISPASCLQINIPPSPMSSPELRGGWRFVPGGGYGVQLQADPSNEWPINEL